MFTSVALADWPDYRGPRRDGHSPERNLPVKWSTAGENLLWRAPIGARSAPVIFKNRVYLTTTVGKGATLQERVVSLDADTGKQLWEHRWNVYLSDVPPHRAAWAAPSVDAETGNVYAVGVGGVLLALSPQGKLLWERSLVEELGLVTTHGGRTSSPVVDGDLVIVSGVSTGWGEQARASHRFFGIDKKTGAVQWASTPSGRPYDTTYSPPVIAEVDGTRLFIVGASDGSVVAMKPQTGEPVWRFEMAKRGINTGVAVSGKWAIVSHSEENLDTSEMGLVAAIDATTKGNVGKEQVKWRVPGIQAIFASPVIDGSRIYLVDGGANLISFDFETGKELWRQQLGTIQKASPVFADGKIYVGTENGRFFIIRPHADKAEILSDVLLGQEASPEAIIAAPAISDGRVFVTSVEAMYCIGKKAPAAPVAMPKPSPAPPNAEPAFLLVSPTELLLKPGETAKLRARLFDGKGQFIRDTQAEWALEGLEGTVKPDGTFAPTGGAKAGKIKATAGGLTGFARARVVPPLPWAWDFTSTAQVPPEWVNATGKNALRDLEGNKVLVKLADNPFTKRARAFFGPVELSNYTVMADVKAIEKRRQMGDAGVVAQRYQLSLFGNSQRIDLAPWQPETERTVSKPFAWKSDTWYRLKLTVEPTADGKVRARGKAWPASEAEPAEWMIERVDPIPNLKGSPGIYADAPFEVFFDNIKVTSNQ
ncbi:MAG: PQQ-binding-like beta-propeller repeat protein [Bryobacteraceae bacterium]|nr:PQQ-binding-like beta-propeller repeat protein [Bryobacteraceae bacterium]